MKVTRTQEETINALNTFALHWFVLGQVRANPEITPSEAIENFAEANAERLTDSKIRSYRASFCRFRRTLKNIAP